MKVFLPEHDGLVRISIRGVSGGGMMSFDGGLFYLFKEARGFFSIRLKAIYYELAFSIVKYGIFFGVGHVKLR